MQFFVNMKGSQLICEHGLCFLCEHYVQLNLPEIVLGFLRWSSLMKMCIHVEQVKSVFF
jgi:hypothetical protein